MSETKAYPGTHPEPKGVDKTVVKAINLSGGIFGACPAHVDVKDGRVVRIRPLHYDSKYDYESFNPWEMERNGMKLRPLSKSVPPPWGLAYKKRTYSPNRVPYPMKRVDWDPNGERNTQNRGSSKFVRISWDEATDIIASEIRRIEKEYGSTLPILVQGDGHSESKLIHAPHGCSTLLLDKMGGFTQQVRNPDSWEGWYWGAKHVWGKGFIGNMAPAENLVNDMTMNTQLLVVQGGDLETTPWGFRGQFASRLMFFWQKSGMEQVYICPDLNYSAAIHANKWIPVLPNTDAALQLAIIYTWVTEGTYDKEYVKTHAVGMDKIEAYVLGKVDGVVKTPKWAEEKCGVPSYTIKALARRWATRATTVGHYFGGGYIRGPYATEPARLEVILLGMQGLGKPGQHHAQIAYMGMPKNITWDQLNYDIANADTSKGFQEYSGTFETIKAKDEELYKRIFYPHRGTPQAWGKQLIPKTLIEEAIKKGTDQYLEFWGTGGHEEEPIDQVIKYTYPAKKGDLRFVFGSTIGTKVNLKNDDTDIPKTYEKIDYDGVPIRMVWTDTPCRQTCWGDGFDIGMTIRSPQIEFVLAQHPWLENDCIYADIVLPTNTTLEVDDIMPCVRDGEHFQSMLNMRKAVEPIGDSKSDFEAVVEIAKKLGMEEKVTIGRTVDQYIEGVYKGMNFDMITPWEEFQEKDYMVIPVSKNWKTLPAGLYEFYMDPEKNPLPTPTGKLEFCSTNLEKYFPNDEERPPYPQWIEKGITHDERRSSSRARTYPLLAVTNHPRWRVHAQADDIPWTKETDTGKVRGFDGYLYEPCWIHPSDAECRGIKNGDIVRVYNERGSVLCGALVFERIIPGAVSIDHGARTDIIIPGKLDRGGAINTITPKGLTSRYAGGQATTSFLVEVERLSMEQYDEWKTNYPEAWNREYDRASGLKASAWVERGCK